MTKKAAMEKLKINGYCVHAFMQGGYIAKKNGRSYKADTLNELVNMIFGL